MRKLAFAVAAALLVAPAALAAQVCFGYPAARGQSDLGGVIRLQSHLSQFGGTYSGHYESDVVADGLLTYDHYSAGEFKANGFTAGARLGLALHSAALSPSVAICPNAGLSVRHLEGHNAVTIPIGIGVGGILRLQSGSPVRRLPSRFAAPRGGTNLLLFATPAVAWSHISGGPSGTFATAELGARLLFGGAYAGASVIVASGGRDAVLGLNAGFPLPR